MSHRCTATVFTMTLLVLSALPATASDDHAHSSTSFGPFDAGEARAVKRQGENGRARTRHPAVGAADKVPGEGPAAPPLRADPDVPETALDHANDVGPSMSSNPLFLAALVYRHFLTKADGPRCQHMPTCSRFASQAVARHGPYGILMAIDRVIQPPMSSSVRSLPQIQGWGDVRFLDPVANYEFWNEDRFTGLPPATEEEPLMLDPPAKSDALASLSAAAE